MPPMTLRKPRTTARSSEPLTNTVVNTLRDQIQSGYYKAGDWLPTERTLSEELGVDRRVIRTAVNQLVRTGLAIRRPHCRPIVGTVDAAAFQRAAGSLVPSAARSGSPRSPSAGRGSEHILDGRSENR